MVAEITGILVVLPRAMHTPLISIELWIPGAGVLKGSLGIGVPLSPSNPHPPPPLPRGVPYETGGDARRLA